MTEQTHADAHASEIASAGLTVNSADDDRTANNGVRHAYRVLSEPEKLAMIAVKDAGAAMLKVLDAYCHPGRETSLARTKTEEAVMWAVKGITG